MNYLWLEISWESCIEDPKAAFRLKSDLLASWNHMGSLRGRGSWKSPWQRRQRDGCYRTSRCIRGRSLGTVSRAHSDALLSSGNTTTTHLRINTKTNTTMFLSDATWYISSNSPTLLLPMCIWVCVGQALKPVFLSTQACSLTAENIVVCNTRAATIVKNENRSWL